MVLTGSLIALCRGIAFNESDPFPQRMHGLRIQFHSPDRGHVRTSPVKIKPSVLIQKQVRVPEIKGSRDFFIRSLEDILRPVETAVFSPLRRTEINIISHDPHIRRVIIERQTFGQAVVFPYGQVLRNPDPERHGRKDVILSFKPDHGRIRSLSRHFDPFVSLVIIKLIPVIHIDRIAEIVHPDFLLFSQTYLFINSALSWKDFTGDLSAQFLWLSSTTASTPFSFAILTISGRFIFPYPSSMLSDFRI